MPAVIEKRLKSLSVGVPLTSGDVTVIPLSGEARSRVEYRHLADALASGELLVHEREEGGVVSELVVENRCGVPVLLLDGEVLAGGKQNRVINTSVLVAPGRKTSIPVSCVEEGRWDRGYGHRSSGYHSPSRIRSSLRKSSLESLRSEGSHASDQSEVWDEVGDVLYCMGSESHTGDLSQAYEDHSEDLQRFSESIRLPEDSVGMLIAIHGRFVAGDVFDRRESLERYRARLLESAALEAMSTRSAAAERVGGSPTREDAEAFLGRAGSAPEESYGSPGMGAEIRSEDEELLVSALAIEEDAIHVGLYAAS